MNIAIAIDFPVAVDPPAPDTDRSQPTERFVRAHGAHRRIDAAPDRYQRRARVAVRTEASRMDPAHSASAAVSITVDGALKGVECSS